MRNGLVTLLLMSVLMSMLAACGGDDGDGGTSGSGSAGTTAGTGVAGTGAGTGAAPSGDYANISRLFGGPEQAGIGKCAASSCHGGTGKAGLSFKTVPNVADALVDVPSCENSSMVLVKPGSPDESWLWIKLTAEINNTNDGLIQFEGTPSTCSGVSTGFGTRMPQVLGSFAKLSDTDLESIRLWIVAGAPGPT